MKPYGYVWVKEKHEAKFFWTEREAKDIQNMEIVRDSVLAMMVG